MKKILFKFGVALILWLTSTPLAPGATITIVNADGPNEGFNDPSPAAPVGGNTGTTVGQQRLQVFQRASQIWGQVLDSQVPILVSATFDPFPTQCTPSGGFIGFAGPTTLMRNFAGAPMADTYYPVALANALAGVDLDPTDVDINAQFNSDVGTPTCLSSSVWYYGLDGNAPGNGIDLLQTVLHELAHGLGFLTVMNASTGVALNGIDDIYMKFLEDHNSGQVFPNLTPAQRAAACITVTGLHWVGPSVVAASGMLTAGRHSSGHVEMYAPPIVVGASSVSHFSTSLLPNELMEPSINNDAERILTLALFRDIGWPAPPTSPAFSVSDVTVVEGTGSASFDITLNPVWSSVVTVDFTTAGLTANPGTDFVATSGTLTFGPGVTVQTIFVPIIGDLVTEPTEAFQLVLSNPTGGSTIGDGTGVGTITDDDTPTFVIAGVSVLEGNAGTTNAVFVVTVSPTSPTPVSVNYASANATATAGTDYTAATGTLTFPANTSSMTISVPVTGDLVVEADETFQINLSTPGGGAAIGVAIATGTIVNDDIPLLVSGEPIGVIEGTGGTTNAAFLITLSRPNTNAATTVDYATRNNPLTGLSSPTATAGADYTAATGTITFGVGVTSQVVNVTVNSDAILETIEVFQLVLSNASPGLTITNGAIPCTISDDDDPSFPMDLVVYPDRNPQSLAAALTAGGGSALMIRNVSLQGHSDSGGPISSGRYELVGPGPNHTYSLELPGIALSSGSVLDYQSGTNQINGFTTAFGPPATAAQETLLDPITGGPFSHFDVTELDIVFDVSPTANQVSFRVVFGSEEWPDFVNSSFIDGFGIFLNGTNIAFTSAQPININHTDMAPIPGTELNAVIAPAGLPVLQFNAPITPGAVSNVLTFIICDTTDRSLDTTIYISSLQAIEPPVTTGEKPVITSFSPQEAPVGSAVTIQGDNFSPIILSNVVYFGAVRAQVLSASESTLIVRVPRGATFSPITVTVNGLTAYTDAPFMPTFLSNNLLTPSSLSPKIDLVIGNGPRSVAAGDLDGDGRPDLAIANFTSGNISILRNVTTPQGVNQGSFASKVDFPTGAGPTSVVLSDVNGDGMLDMIVADYNSARVSVFRNKSDPLGIAFFSRTDYVTGDNPSSVAVEDLDDDGKPDLIVANERNGTVSVLRNTNELGSINPASFAPKVDFVAGSSPSSVAVGDIDNDGHPDIVVANGFNGPGGNSITVFRNRGITNSMSQSFFDLPRNFAVGNGPNSVALGDIDSDGLIDIATANSVNGNITLLQNSSGQGVINLTVAGTISSGVTTRKLAFGDIDGNGQPDLVVANQLVDRISVLRNVHSAGAISAASFAARVQYVTSKDPYGVTVADLDADGKPEIITANQNGTISLFKNLAKADPTILWSSPPSITYGEPLTAVHYNATAQHATTNLPGSFLFLPGIGTVLNAGSDQTLTAVFVPSDRDSFNIVTNTAQIDVARAPLTIEAADAARSYGAPNPTFSANFTGFVNGDTGASLDVQPSFVTSAVMTSPIGIYPISVSGAVDANYDIQFDDGTLTVVRASLSVKADDKSRAYGQANPTLTATITGFVNGETDTILTSPVMLQTAADANTAAGTYPIVASGAAADNYTITYTDGTLTITSADPPVITLQTTALDYTENTGAQLIDDLGSVSDGGSANFDTGTLTISFASGGAAEDRLSIRNQGTGSGEIGTSGNQITFSGVLIGTFSGGNSHTNPLVILLNASATPAVASTLIANLTYENVSDNPSTTARVIRMIISDGDGGTSAPATRTVTVIPENDLPVANNQNLSLTEDGSRGITLSGSDVDSVALTFSIVNPPAQGVLNGAPPNVTYVPAANFSGTDQFTYKANDGTADSTPATVFLNVSPSNDAPTASGQSVITDEDISVPITLQTADPDLDALLYIFTTQPTKGVLSGTAPNLTYTPNLNISGTDSFSYRVTDGILTSAVANVSITINAINDAPTLGTLANRTYNEDASQQVIVFSGVTSGASNESQTLTVTAVTDNTDLLPNLTLQYTSPSQGGSIMFTPAADLSGTANITVTVNDGAALNATASRTFTVTVQAVNDPPTLFDIPNPAPILVNSGLQMVQLFGISSGAINEIQTLTVTATSDNPSLIPDPSVTYISPDFTGLLSYTPGADAQGTATITVTVSDGSAANPTVTKTFQVSVVENLPPIIFLTAPAEDDRVDFGKPINFTVDAYDIDGTVAKVEFYDGIVKVGESTIAPFDFAYSGAALGDRILTAKAIDDEGAETISDDVLVKVATAVTSVALDQQGQFTLNYQGSAGITYVVEVSTDLINWSPIGTFIGASNAVPFVDPNSAGAGLRFYRVRPQAAP